MSNFDCQSCGACCVEAGSVPVYSGENVPRYLTRSVRNCFGFAAWEAEDGIRQMAKYPGGRCKALKGTVGASCACGIYARRPEVCRDFEPGSDACIEARRAAERKMKQMELRPRGYGANWEETVIL
jgi:Fe-S-cluster containining protein